MNETPITVMLAWNQDWLSALDRALPPRSVIVLEERDLYEGKRIAQRWGAGHPALREVRFTEYQQSERFREDVLRLAAEVPVRAVLPGLEYSVEAAAGAAESLGLPGGGSTAAAILRDKLRLREVCAAAGLPTPRFAEVTSASDVASFAAGGPCVVKPANRQASLGVVLLDAGARASDIAAAWRDCAGADEGVQMAHRPMRWRYLAEERLTGPEYSVEALVQHGRVAFTNVTRKRVHPGRHPIERGHLVPAPPGPGVASLAELMAALVSAVGFDTGLLHAEWIVDRGQPVLIECAGRPPGDWIIDLIELTQGVELYAAAEQALAGRTPDLSAGPGAGAGWTEEGSDEGSEHPKGPGARASEGERSGPTVPYAAVEFLVPTCTGTVVEVIGVDAAGSIPGVHRVPLVRAPGDMITSLDSSWCRLAAVIATGPSARAAEAAAAGGLGQIKVTLA